MESPVCKSLAGQANPVENGKEIIMKLGILFCCTLMCPLAFAASQSKNGPVPATSASEIPHLRKQGTATQLIVDGKPFLALAGRTAQQQRHQRRVHEAGMAQDRRSPNSTPSWRAFPGPRSNHRKGSSTSACWTASIRDARSHNLRLVLLWFATWKNGLSSYPPDWVKKDFERFPRAQMVGDNTPWPVFGAAAHPRSRGL